MRLLATLVLCFACASAFAAEPVWPQWRGPSRDGLIDPANTPAWPDSLKEDSLKLVWRVPLGKSYSGPIVSGNRVYVTESPTNSEETTVALDRATGTQAWRSAWKGGMMVPFFAMSNGSWIRSTPALDGPAGEGGALYVGGMRDVLTRLDAATGKEAWRVDFVERFKSPLPAFGLVCSPLVTADGVYVQAGAAVVKLDKKTGETIWRGLVDEGGMNGSAFSSPIITKLAGRDQLLIQSRTTLAGLDPATGKVLWYKDIPAFRGMNILTPVPFGGNRVFTCAYGGKALALEIAEKDGALTATQIWDAQIQAYMSTPVVIDGHVYLHLRNQRFTCIELATGKVAWTSSPFGQYWSLVARGDRILALDQKGELLLIRATPEKFDLLDRRTVSEQQTWAHLAVVGNEVYVRELEGLAVYRWGK